jgi:cytochrome c oxidase subunit 1
MNETQRLNSIDGPPAGWLKRYIYSTDHKIIAMQFLFVSLLFFALGGLLAMLIRWQLAFPGDANHPVPILGRLMDWPGGLMPPDFYNMVFSMHATIMVFFVIIPLLVNVFGNYLIPLKIGARDMAFEFLNGLSFWAGLPAGAIMLAGFFLPGNAASAGWTSYPPLSAIWQNGREAWPLTPIIINFIAAFLCFGYVCAYGVKLRGKFVTGAVSILLSGVAAWGWVVGVRAVAFDGQSAWFLSLLVLGFVSLLGAINYITTVVKLRCPGMTMFRMPLSVWSLFITAILVLLATPVLGAAMVMNLMDHHRLTGFFSDGGVPLLHQHLFWFYSHPAVYIMILPAMGMVSDILPVFSRKPVFGYRPMVYAMASIAFLGFVVWGHHMFQSGMNPALATTFAISSMFIAVPSGVKVFNWLATMWGGNIRFTVPMCNAIAFVSMFVIGGLSGIFMASTPVDIYITDTYFIVAHIHYVLFGGSMFGVFAAIYYWYPKMFGRMMNDKLGYVHFVLTFITFNCTFFAMHILGIAGFPRRYADYTHFELWAHFKPMNQFISYSAFALALSQIPFIINFIGSWIWGRAAPANPWQANTLEWTDVTSPPPRGNFARIPVVHRGPYEYSSPCVAEDWLPQTRVLVEPASAKG